MRLIFMVQPPILFLLVFCDSFKPNPESEMQSAMRNNGYIINIWCLDKPFILDKDGNRMLHLLKVIANLCTDWNYDRGPAYKFIPRILPIIIQLIHINRCKAQLIAQSNISIEE